TLKDVQENFVLINSDSKTQVQEMKRAEGKDMALYGGANLLASMLNDQLVDEIIVSFIPVLLGAGKPMVDLLQQKVWLDFQHSRRYSNGTLMIHYAVNYTNA
ncbi:MAG TPA: dihydrofolate reductase family protein, partial [Flavisolibacter sp.]|nr:dihydrofolate reductase family protein [Flavisolibacter sp.]